MKNRGNIKLFFKGYKIAKETIDLIKQEDGQKENLNDYIVGNSYSQEVMERLTNLETLAATQLAYNRTERFEQVKILELKMLKRARVRRIRNLAITFSSAAAVVLLSLLILRPEVEIERGQSLITNNQVTVPTLITNDQTKIALHREDEGKKIAIETTNRGDKKIEVQYNTIVVPSKYTYTIVLPDSTRVTLNANSELRYPVHFNSQKREVFLKGEGYFEVTKDEIPFVVKASEVSVRVYGTQFNVNTNCRDMIETLLISGSVGITHQRNQSKEVMIKPNEMFSFNTSTGEVTRKRVNCENYIAWKNNLFMSEDEALSSLLDKIALWYGVEFKYDREKIQNVVIGYIQLNRSLEIDNILKGLEVMTNVKFINDGKGKYVVE